MSKPTKGQELMTLQNRIVIARAAGNADELARLVDAREMARSTKRPVSECEAAVRKVYEEKQIAVEYAKLPMLALREIAEQAGITIDYHPQQVRLTKGEKTVTVTSDRKEMLKTIMEWTD